MWLTDYPNLHGGGEVKGEWHWSYSVAQRDLVDIFAGQDSSSRRNHGVGRDDGAWISEQMQSTEEVDLGMYSFCPERGIWTNAPRVHVPHQPMTGTSRSR
jgi:hypothetical protein